MADLSSTIDIIFRGVDNVSQAAQNVSSSLSSINGAAKNISDPFAGLASSLALIQGALLGVAGVMVGMAVNETVKFKDSLYLVDKQLAGSGVALDDARVKIEQLGLQYGINANDIAASMAGFLAGGNDFKNSATLVETALQFMIAGEISATKATDVLTAALSGWRVPTAEAAAGAQKVGDILNKLADISQSRLLEPIADAFTRVSPAAYSAGLSMEETGAVVARLVDVFQSGEIAGTALSSGLSSLSAPTAEATEKITALGVSVRNQGGDLRLSGDILKDLAAKWGTLTDAQQAEAAAIIFGKEQADKFKVVLGDWAKIQEYLGKTLDATTGAVGSLARETEGKLKLISTSVDQANESWRQFLENLGAKITDDDQLNGLIGNLGAVGVAFKDVVSQGGFDPLIDLLKNQAGDLSALLESVAKNLPDALADVDFSPLVTAFESLGDQAKKALEALFGPVDLSTVEGLQKAIQGVADTLAGLVKVTAGELGGLAPFLAGVREMTTRFREADPATQQFIGQMLGIGVGVNQAANYFDPILVSLASLVVLAGPAGVAIAAIRAELAALATVLSGGALATFIGVAGLAGAVGLLAFELTRLSGMDQVLNDILVPDKLAGYQGASVGTLVADLAEKLGLLDAKINEVPPKLEKLSKPIPVTQFDGAISAIARFEAEVQDSERAYESYFNIVAKPIPVTQWDGMLSKMDDLAGVADKTGEAVSQSIIEWGKALGKIPPVELPKDVEKIPGVFSAAGKAATAYGGAIEGVAVSYSQIGSGTVKATGAFAAVADKTADAKDQLDALTKGGKLTVDQLTEITKTANDFEVKMEEIASNERIKTIEATVSLNTARLETDMERVKSAFSSIDNTITSTGELLMSLFGNLTDTDDRYKELAIEEQIDLENKRRQEQLDLQKKLVEAEIARIEAQTRVMDRGDPWIKIDGTRLQPQLEAFMWEILKAIRTQVNAEFANFLLGVGA